MNKFIFGIYEDIKFTRQVISSLRAAGIPASSISLIVKDNLVHDKDFSESLDDIQVKSIDEVDSYTIDLSAYKKDIDDDKILVAVDEAFEAKAYQAKQNSNSQVVDDEAAGPIDLSATADADNDDSAEYVGKVAKNRADSQAEPKAEVELKPGSEAEASPADYLSDSSYYDQGEQARKVTDTKESVHKGLSDVQRPVTPIQDQNKVEKRYDR